MLDKIKLTKGQKTAQKILEAAAECISKMGVEKTSVTNIANQAGLKRSLIAYHFPKKDEVIYKVVEMVILKLRSFVNKRITNHTSKSAMQNIFAGYIEFFNEHPHYFHVMLHFYYLSSINKRAREINTINAMMSLDRLTKHFSEYLDENGASVPLSLIRKFSWALHMWIIGTIMNSHCVSHQISNEDYIKQNIILFDKQVSFMMESIKSGQVLDQTNT